MIQIQDNLSKLNLPKDIKFFSKKEILDMIHESTNTVVETPYYSPITGKKLNAILNNNKCFAKQYPYGRHYYLVDFNTIYREVPVEVPGWEEW